MMTIEARKQYVEQFTYRRGWVLQIWEHPWEGAYLTVVAVVDNAYDNDKPLTVTINVPVPPIPDPDYFDVWLQWRLALIENHESREFLRQQGKPIFNPHADGANDPSNKDELKERALREFGAPVRMEQQEETNPSEIDRKS